MTIFDKAQKKTHRETVNTEEPHTGQHARICLRQSNKYSNNSGALYHVYDAVISLYSL